MAYTIVNSVLKQATSGTGSGNSAAVSMVNADLLVGIVAYGSSGGTGNITDSLGNTYTSAVVSNVQGPICALWYCQAPTVSGSMTFASTTGNSCSIAVAGYKGSAPSPLDQTNTGNSATTSCPTGSVTITAGELVVFGLTTNSTGTVTVSPGQKRKGAAAGFAEGVVIADIIGGAAGAQSSTFSLSASGANDAVIASFKVAAAGGGNLFAAPNLDGISTGGPFFADRLAMMHARRGLIHARRPGIISDIRLAA